MACLPEYDEEPIISDVQKAVRTLNSLCKLMERRYDLLKMAQVKKIEEYNEKFIHHRLDLRKGHEYMPYIVVIIDEFSDLIIAEGQNIESPITRIAQSGRTVGIHMVISTNRPTNDIITGHIKANIPARMAFRLPERIDSQVILDYNGAEKLTRNGEMLFRKDKENDFIRIQCAFIDTPEIESIIDHIAEQPGPVEPASLPEPTYDNYGEWSGGEMADLRQLDPYFNEAAHAIVLSQQGSTSMIQRRFSIGYNRAGRLMDQLEQAGIVGAAMGSKPRDVLVQDENTLNEILSRLNEN
jgi:S-DNA-T family DNA segregation ATPase FtsK/SpoIIIE